MRSCYWSTTHPPSPSRRRHVCDGKRRVTSLFSLGRGRLSRDRRYYYYCPSGAAAQQAVIGTVKCSYPPSPRPRGLSSNGRRRVSSRLPAFALARLSCDRRLPSCAFTRTYMQHAAHGDGVSPLDFIPNITATPTAMTTARMRLECAYNCYGIKKTA